MVLTPTDVLAHLQRIEKHVESFDNKSYYGFGAVFDGLTSGGMPALNSPDAIQRFDAYFARAKVKLVSDPDPELLAIAIGRLGVVVPHLEESQRTRCYDELSQYAQAQVRDHSKEGYWVVRGLSKAIGSLPIADIPERMKYLRERARNVDEVELRQSAFLVSEGHRAAIAKSIQEQSKSLKNVPVERRQGPIGGDLEKQPGRMEKARRWLKEHLPSRGQGQGPKVG